ncbi:MAG: DeoR/GlpR family DNA-binding transcription regulator [Paracoccaceae bacterium]
MELLARSEPVVGPRLRKSERREQILLDLRLRPHVRIAELAQRFGVTPETVRRDVDALSKKGLISRAHGGASAQPHGYYPGFDERSRARLRQRERIGKLAAGLVHSNETVMIDSGSTTLQLARFLAFEGTPCTVLTNSLQVAMALGQGDKAQVILCPGDYLATEAAVVGAETIEFLGHYRVDRCLIGASGLSEAGPSETVRGFAAIKRAMIRRSAATHLLIDSEKFDRTGLAHVGDLGALASVVVEKPPEGNLNSALREAGVEVLVAP